jgi:hypothetical protein
MCWGSNSRREYPSGRCGNIRSYDEAAEHHLARELRRAGLPYKRIASRIGVSPSSVHAWTKDIELSEEQKSLNLRGRRGPQNPELIRRRAESWAARCRAARLASQEDGRRAAREGDPLHQAGCMLYWAEGAKRRNTIHFTNSDPHMLAFFRRFLTEVMAIECDEIAMSINVYTNNGLTIGDIERYWLDLLELPPCSVRKHMLNHMPTSSSGRAKNKLPLRRGDAQRAQHLDAPAHLCAIQEYAGFDEPAWLD